MVVNVHILYLFSHCVSFALLIIDFIVILHVRLIRVLLKINQSINQSINQESLFVPSLGIVAGLGNSFIVRNVVFLCSHFGWQFNEFKGKLVSEMQGFCHTFMTRLLMVIGVQLIIIGYHE